MTAANTMVWINVHMVPNVEVHIRHRFQMRLLSEPLVILVQTNELIWVESHRLLVDVRWPERASFRNVLSLPTKPLLKLVLIDHFLQIITSA